MYDLAGPSVKLFSLQRAIRRGLINANSENWRNAVGATTPNFGDGGWLAISPLTKCQTRVTVVVVVVIREENMTKSPTRVLSLVAAKHELTGINLFTVFLDIFFATFFFWVCLIGSLHSNGGQGGEEQWRQRRRWFAGLNELKAVANPAREAEDLCCGHPSSSLSHTHTPSPQKR